MTDILITHGFVITMNPRREVIRDGGVAIQGGRIVAVGRVDEVLQRFPHADYEIDATNHVVLPGFINTHAHNFQVLFKSLGDDMLLEEWMPKAIRPMRLKLRAEDCYWAGLASSLESIRGGITTTVDFHYVHTEAGCSDRILEAYVKTGIRGIETRIAADADRFQRFAPGDPMLESTDQVLREGRRFIARWRGKADGRVTGWFGPGAVWTCSDDLFREAVQIALEEGTRFPVHLNETQGEVQQWKRLTGVHPIEYAYRLDQRLGDTMLAVHCVWLDETEFGILKKGGIAVSYNPLSNMYLSSGIAPVSRMLREGITVSLGADGQASNNGQDHFELIRTGVLLQKVSTLDPQAISAEKGLEMATIDAAKAIGQETTLGSLEPGKRADLLIMQLSTANMRPINRVPSQIVYCGKSSDLDYVIIDGKIVLENKGFTCIDEQMVLEKTQRVADDLVDRAGCREHRERGWRALPKQDAT